MEIRIFFAEAINNPRCQLILIFIVKNIRAGLTASAIARQMKAGGYLSTESNIRAYVKGIAKKYNLELSKYCRTAPRYNEDGSRALKSDYITRKGIFNHLWMGVSLTAAHRDHLWKQYSVLTELDACIRQFREIFEKKSMPSLYIFIERYQNSEYKELTSFANGLKKDIDAVENAVASPLSNGFVEGTNSKVKSIKKTMYGRCGRLLLAAKLMYNRNS